MVQNLSKINFAILLNAHSLDILNEKIILLACSKGERALIFANMVDVYSINLN